MSTRSDEARGDGGDPIDDAMAKAFQPGEAWPTSTASAGRRWPCSADGKSD